MSDATIQRLVMIMDMNGYEQDGSGTNFIHLSTGKPVIFVGWGEVYDFIRRNLI